MTRLLLATALVLHLSGVSAVAAFVCAQPGMTAQTCCCHHERSSDGAPEAAAPCPCAMAPPLPAPVTQTPVTASASRILVSTPAVLAGVWSDLTDGMRALAASHAVFADTGPPLVSASHLRC
jgi:hypothetical protein